MFANQDSPPPKEPISVKPRIDHAAHTKKLQEIADILSQAIEATDKAAHSAKQYKDHSFLSSPFVSKNEWDEEVRKWNKAVFDLEREYFLLLCALNSDAYKAITE